MLVIGIILGVIFLFLVVLYHIYFFTFRVTKRLCATPHTLPPHEQYTRFAKEIHKNVDDLLALEYESVFIQSHDGLTLCAKYYEVKKGAPLMIVVHGYRSNGFRDANGAFKLCLENGYNVLIIDQRAHGGSGGRHLTFGIKERFDVLDWVNYAKKRFPDTQKIALLGVSMGATSVLLASEFDISNSVGAIVADCGYTCPEEIIKQVIRTIKLPKTIMFFLISLSAKLFARIDLSSVNVADAVSKTTIPILYIHGDDDRFVPCQMSKENYQNTASEKEIVIVKDAAHGMSYYYDTKLWHKSVTEFLDKHLNKGSGEND